MTSPIDPVTPAAALRRAFVLVSTLACIACGGGGVGDGATQPPPVTPPVTPPAVPVPVANVTVSAAATSLFTGDTTRVSARASGADGTTLTGRSVQWRSADAAVATVSVDGLVSAVAPGTARVTATVEGVTGTVDLLVANAPLASLALAQSAVTLIPGHQIQLVPTGRDARGRDVAAPVVAWTSSNPAIATVDAGGVVRALSRGGVTLTGASGSVRVSVAVTVLEPGSVDSETQLIEPRVFDLRSTDSMLVTLLLPAAATQLVLTPNVGSPIPFKAISSTRWYVRIPPALITANYVANQTSVVGFYDITQSGSTTRLQATIPVRTAGMPDAAITARSPVAQQTSRVINLRFDTLMQGFGLRYDPQATNGSLLAQRVYALLPDAYDYIMTVENAETRANRYYALLRNSETNIGQGISVAPPGWGSAARLRGHVTYPIVSLFDAGETTALHELAHHWLSRVPGISAVPHWAPGNLAYGVMGFSQGSGLQGSQWNYLIEEPTAGNFVWRCRPAATSFNEAELYIMGLLPRDSARTVFFQPATAPPGGFATCNGPVAGAVRRLTIDSIVTALGGVRAPAVQRDFQIATVVFSYGRLLGSHEMAWLDYMASRGEAESDLTSNTGLVIGVSTKPWFLATGGRSRLRFRL